ncbi:amidase family protein [Caballeronia sordidicola]|uniref:amidase family protein n=1 Tax=Caballeronia sordidicola TaxID=196367 RepID=UPI000A6F1273
MSMSNFLAQTLQQRILSGVYAPGEVLPGQRNFRAPASHCGLIGLRPTHARVSLDGCMPLSPGFDTCGRFTRDIETFARVGALNTTSSMPATMRLCSSKSRSSRSRAERGAERRGAARRRQAN